MSNTVDIAGANSLVPTDPGMWEAGPLSVRPITVNVAKGDSIVLSGVGANDGAVLTVIGVTAGQIDVLETLATPDTTQYSFALYKRGSVAVGPPGGPVSVVVVGESTTLPILTAPTDRAMVVDFTSYQSLIGETLQQAPEIYINAYGPSVMGGVSFALIGPTVPSTNLQFKQTLTANNTIGFYPRDSTATIMELCLSPTFALDSFIGETLEGTWTFRFNTGTAGQPAAWVRSWRLYLPIGA